MAQLDYRPGASTTVGDPSQTSYLASKYMQEAGNTLKQTLADIGTVFGADDAEDKSGKGNLDAAQFNTAVKGFMDTGISQQNANTSEGQLRVDEDVQALNELKNKDAQAQQIVSNKFEQQRIAISDRQMDVNEDVNSREQVRFKIEQEDLKAVNAAHAAAQRLDMGAVQEIYAGSSGAVYENSSEQVYSILTSELARRQAIEDNPAATPEEKAENRKVALAAGVDFSVPHTAEINAAIATATSMKNYQAKALEKLNYTDVQTMDAFQKNPAISGMDQETFGENMAKAQAALYRLDPDANMSVLMDAAGIIAKGDSLGGSEIINGVNAAYNRRQATLTNLDKTNALISAIELDSGNLALLKAKEKTLVISNEDPTVIRKQVAELEADIKNSSIALQRIGHNREEITADTSGEAEQAAQEKAKNDTLQQSMVLSNAVPDPEVVNAFQDAVKNVTGGTFGISPGKSVGEIENIVSANQGFDVLFLNNRQVNAAIKAEKFTKGEFNKATAVANARFQKILETLPKDVVPSGTKDIDVASIARTIRLTENSTYRGTNGISPRDKQNLAIVFGLQDQGLILTTKASKEYREKYNGTYMDKDKRY